MNETPLMHPLAKDKQSILINFSKSCQLIFYKLNKNSKAILSSIQLEVYIHNKNIKYIIF